MFVFYHLLFFIRPILEKNSLFNHKKASINDKIVSKD